MSKWNTGAFLIAVGLVAMGTKLREVLTIL